MKRKLTAALACLILVATAASQDCPGGRCPAPQSAYRPQYAPPPPTNDGPPKVECVNREGRPPTHWIFKVDGRDVGYMDEDTCRFHPLAGGFWDFHPKAVAGDPPGLFGQGPEPNAVPPGGIDADKLTPPGRERCTINGVEVPRARAFAALGAPGNLVDDSKFLRLTVIGPDADRKRVLDDIKAHPGLADQAARMLVRDYPPDHSDVREAGFKTDGKPTIYVQAADGKVLWRQDDYDGGADQLAGAIRKRRPDYDPSKDPGPKPLEPLPGPGPPAPKMPIDLNAILLLIGGAVIAWLSGRPRQPVPTPAA